jgi:hypothetical protein
MSDQNKDQEEPLFQGIDEYERTYAPEELPPDDPERKRAVKDEESDAGATDLEPPSAAPVGTLGTSPSGAMAPVNEGREKRPAPIEVETDAPDLLGEADAPEEEV